MDRVAHLDAGPPAELRITASGTLTSAFGLFRFDFRARHDEAIAACAGRTYRTNTHADSQSNNNYCLGRRLTIATHHSDRGALAPGQRDRTLCIMSKQDELEDRETWFLNVVQHPGNRAQALKQAEKLREDTDPEIQTSDLEAAKCYVRACMDNLSFTELERRSEEQFVALWGRGTLGAARYRANKVASTRKSKRR